MRRFLVVVVATAAVAGWAAAASAKGWEHSRMIVAVDGLRDQVVRQGEDAWRFFDELGIGELKWDAPNVSGTLRPNLELGRPYVATVTFRCSPSRRSEFAITLYPRAEGGPQLLIAQGGTICDGRAIQPGWWPLREEILRPFFRLGLVRPNHGTPSAGVSPAAIAASEGPSSGSPTAALLGVAALVLLGVIGLPFLRRKR